MPYILQSKPRKLFSCPASIKEMAACAPMNNEETICMFVLPKKKHFFHLYANRVCGRPTL